MTIVTIILCVYGIIERNRKCKCNENGYLVLIYICMWWNLRLIYGFYSITYLFVNHGLKFCCRHWDCFYHLHFQSCWSITDVGRSWGDSCQGVPSTCIVIHKRYTRLASQLVHFAKVEWLLYMWNHMLMNDANARERRNR